MWQYSTETIINSNKGNLIDGARFGLYDPSEDDAQVSAIGQDTMFIVDGNNAFKPLYVSAIYKTEGRAAVRESIDFEIKLGESQAGDVLRLLVVIREEGRQSSPMQNAYLRHMKPFFYEIASEGDAAKDAAKFAALIKKDMADTDFHYFKAKNEKGEAVLTLVADDAHVRFVSVELAQVPQKYSCDCPTFEDLGAKLLGWKDYVLIKKNVEGGKDDLAFVYTVDEETGEPMKGDLGAGTVEHIIKDLRIPTNASINPFGADHGGMPIPGMLYDQYLIEYTTDRRHIGHQVMGSANDKSITSHVYFVAQEGLGFAEGKKASEEFEAALDIIAQANSLEIVEAGRKERTAKIAIKANADLEEVDAVKNEEEALEFLAKDPKIGSVE
ncbi:MAG: hypothetical protein Q4C49_00405 [Bacillota bacterium]|nr:hypothetical protein [Bacillota bacterium]